MRTSGKAQLETHLRVAHKVAVHLAVMCDGNGRKPARPQLVNRLDDEFHVWRVIYFEIEIRAPASCPLDEFENGLHHATSRTAASVAVASSSAMARSSAARMTAEVC